jgi:hypothetical protein
MSANHGRGGAGAGAAATAAGARAVVDLGDLKQYGVTAEHHGAYTQAGCDPQTATALLTARIQSSGTINFLDDDIKLLPLLEDPQLLLSILQAGYDVDLLYYNLTSRALTAEHVREAVNLRIDPSHITEWVETGRPVDELADTLDTLPGGSSHRLVVGAIAAGFTRDDLTWLAANGVPLDNDCELHWVLANSEAIAAVATHTTGTTEQRRLLLVLLSRSSFPIPAVTALLASLDNAPWLDTNICIVLTQT